MLNHGDDIYKYKDIRLNFSSNVYNGFDHIGLFEHLSRKMSCVLNYPEPTPLALEQDLAAYLGISAKNVMVTNGATEAIYLIAQSYRGVRSYIHRPTFSEYEEACVLHNHEIVEDKQRAELIWMCNPNNPTGEVFPSSFILHRALHVIDQSYDRFTSHPLLSASDAVEREDVFILHSMTKEYAIPGLRLGYVIASEMLLDALRFCRMPWSVNSLAIEAGRYLLQHDAEYRIDVETLLSERKRVASSLLSLGTMDVYPSDTHILLCRLHHGTAAELKERLASDYGILIRDAANFKGLTPQHFRIAVQSQADNDTLLAALSEVCR